LKQECSNTMMPASGRDLLSRFSATRVSALTVSPRIGHLHYYVDGQSWPIVDTSGETVVLVGLPPGAHQLKLELADATHKPIPECNKVVEFIIPPRK